MVTRVAGVMLAAGMLLMAQGRMARPGTVNYAEGQVTLNGQTIGAKQIGSTEVGPGQVLQTQNGKAEILLTPGVFLRINDHSAVRMVSPDLINTQVDLQRGEAMVEADMVAKESHLVVGIGGVNTTIEKHGIYQFRADQPMVAVFDGKVAVQKDDQRIELGKGKELYFAQAKPQKFDRDSAESADSLYAWSSLRSEYDAEANASMAQTFVAGGPGWYGPGWYWDPYFDGFAFMPGDGFLYSPFGFGWGFYSPAYWRAWGPAYYGGWYGLHRGFVGRPAVGVPRAVAPRAMAAPRMSAPMMGGGARFGGGHFGGRR